MAYKIFDGLSGDTTQGNTPMTLTIDGATLDLPDASFVRDADIQRDGIDLVLEGPEGTLVVEGYFAAEPAPNLVAPNGDTLTPDLVESFMQSTAMYADAGSMNDASPVGSVQEVSGEATVTRLDGSVETITIGTPIYQGDVVETSGDGAVNIVFIDETSFAVSEDARLAIDEYVFDPASQAGTSNFSVLKGVFVFTSGLIGRDDPDDVEIDTPMGSIGIRGTIIMGDADSGEITVVEGAIVLRDLSGNEMTLAKQFETGKFMPGTAQGIEHMGEMGAQYMAQKFSVISGVAGDLFSSLHDAANEDGGEDGIANQNPQNLQDGEGENEGEVQHPQQPPRGMEDMTGEDMGLMDGVHERGTLGGPLDPLKPPPPPPETDGSSAGTDPYSYNATGGTNEAPPLVVNVQLSGVPENSSGNPVVALLHGDFAQAVNFSLLGPNATLYTLNQIDATTAEVVFNGMAPDLETGSSHLPFVRFAATNGTGSAAVQGDLFIPVTNVNEAPKDAVTGSEATEFFAASEGNRWVHFFNKEFQDPDFGDQGNLTFTLDNATVTDLNGTFSPFLDTAMGGGDGWDFDINTGKLELFFNSTFPGGAGTSTGLNIGITAQDSGGLQSNSGAPTPFSIMVYKPDQDFFIGVLSNSGWVASDSGGDNNLFINSTSNTKAFGGDDDDNITINSSGMNTVHGGDGDDSMTVSGSLSTQNILIGGYGNDDFIIQNADNKAYGGDGDDDFVLDQFTITALESSSLANQRIDGGWNDMRFGQFANSGGRGDSLVLQGSDNINFSNIFVKGNTIQGIERIDTKTATGANTVTLDYNDVLTLTSGPGTSKNTLILNMDSNDNLVFSGGNLSKVDNVTLDDAKAGASPVPENYDVYSDGNVTLLVNTDMAQANITGL